MFESRSRTVDWATPGVEPVSPEPPTVALSPVQVGHRSSSTPEPVSFQAGPRPLGDNLQVFSALLHTYLPRTASGAAPSDPAVTMAALASSTDAELLAHVRTVEDLLQTAEALRTFLYGEVEARSPRGAGVATEDSLAKQFGYRTAHDLLKQLTLQSGASINKALKLAQSCRPVTSLTGEYLPAPFAHVTEGLTNGTLNVEAAATITRELGRLPANVDHDLIELAEETLVARATGIPAPGDPDAGSECDQGADASFGIRFHADDIRTLTSTWMTVLDQDGTPPSETAVERRFFRVGRERNGLVPVQGHLTPEVAGFIGRIFDTITSPRTTTNELDPFAPGSEPDGSSPGTFGERASRVRFTNVDESPGGQLDPEPTDTRTRPQQLHDALAIALELAANSRGMPNSGGAPVTLVIQTTEEEYLAHVKNSNGGGAAWIHDVHGSPSPVSMRAASHAGCAGTTLRIIQNEYGKIVNLVTHERLFNHHQRKAILARDGGCIIPGCNTPPGWCEIHHVNEWANSGSTDTSNGVALCWYHHRYLDHHGWQIRMCDGVPEVRAPLWLDPHHRWRRPAPLTKPPRLLRQ